MRTYDLALIGFGGVSRALAELISSDAERLTRQLGFSLRVVAITDLAFGSLVQPDGIDLAAVLAMPRGADFSALPGGSADPRNHDVIQDCPADIVVEATFTNPVDGQPAASHVRWALESGKHVTTTNKGPVALHARALTALAEERGLSFEFEGAVLSGTPILRFAQQMLPGLTTTSVEGILNGTSNYVLGRREAGATLEAAIREAQELGYAEADPTADIEGSDVRLKVAILAQQVLGVDVSLASIDTQGISGISDADIREASEQGLRWKLIGSATRTDDGGVTAAVRPVALGEEHPLAGIAGATNAVTFTTDLLGQVTVSGPGAGRVETAYALLSDIIAIDAATRTSERAAAAELVDLVGVTL
ncbi:MULTISPECIES: homoserine dehydrogenase [unclassified Pseudoclavibacter]|uniref:homoserine dehydrogenase n=1 Tax=unclassified Pseudoclavibacter TaxID=2615177 RepID=UPI000CE8D295|nr:MULTISPECIES: homoserine dehydrogenase [unclassified Pseudoclavibacter]MBS3179938.1 homoserine dehydrogenase [Pseudoclavibacter sp. Marseille-Q4354]PPG33392.1 homoserine dehydrogenase [Pseudoclavibacter sp. RFBB5]